jgi:hypothetical protein
VRDALEAWLTPDNRAVVTYLPAASAATDAAADSQEVPA